MANKCIICGKYCQSGQIAHSKCLNKSDMVLEKVLKKKGGWAQKYILTESGNPVKGKKRRKD